MTCEPILTIICHSNHDARRMIRKNLGLIGSLKKNLDFAVLDTPSPNELIKFMSCRTMVDLLVLERRLWDGVNQELASFENFWVFLVEGLTIRAVDLDGKEPPVELEVDPAKIKDPQLFLFSRAIESITGL